MTDFLSLIMHHGYIVISLIVFAEAIGVPVPGAVALVAGGAAAAGTLSGPVVALFAVAAMLSADSLLYIFGNNMGWTILKFLCRVPSIRKHAFCAPRNRSISGAGPRC